MTIVVTELGARIVCDLYKVIYCYFFAIFLQQDAEDEPKLKKPISSK